MPQPDEDLLTPEWRHLLASGLTDDELDRLGFIDALDMVRWAHDELLLAGARHSPAPLIVDAR